MRRISEGNGKGYGQFLVGFIIIICFAILGTGIFLHMTAAYAKGAASSANVLARCPRTGSLKPSPHSLLVVLLDRSGSLTQQPGATDPDGYSTSVTKALADLWPGLMTVIPFSNNATPAFGPADLSDPTQRANLKDQVEHYPIGGNTPLGPALHVALKQLQGAASGSWVIVITDGNPTGQGNRDGAHQEQDIRNNLIRQFCDKGIPISAVGLTIDPSTPDGQDANRLFTDITKGTGATYINVRTSKELATAVIGLYAQWQQLNFTQESPQNGNFLVSIDSFAKQVNVVTFRSDSNYPVSLDGPDGQPVQGVEHSVDRHYVINTLVPGIFVAGTYTMHTSGDPNAEVYTLVSSPLQIHIDAPAPQIAAYGKPIEIKATLLDGNNVLTPVKGQAQLIAHVTLLVDGRQVGPTNDVILVQQGATFEGQTLVYNRAGELRIQIEGSSQGVQRKTSTDLQLVPPPPPPPAPCRLGALFCFWQRHQSQILIIMPLGLFSPLLLVLWVLWQCQPAPYGHLHSKRNEAVDISLKTLPRFPARLIRRSVVKSGEIRNHPKARKGFPLGAANFELVFHRGRRAFIRPAKTNTVPIRLLPPVTQSISRNQNRRNRIGARLLNLDQIDVELKPGELTELPLGSIIIVQDDPLASFESLPRLKAGKQ